MSSPILSPTTKVIVTGANGFLGSWLVKSLLNQGHKVCALVRKTSDLSELEGLECEYIYGDVTDLGSLRMAFRGASAVFHLAGLIAYRTADRPAMERVNVGGTENVITACLEAKVPRLIYLSSVVAVGAGFSSQQILNEKSAFNLHHLNLGYFETKFKAEQKILAAVKERGLNAVILNPSTIYGPGDARKSSRKTQLKVAQGKFPFYTSGGVSIVDIQSVVQGILAAWEKGKNGERYILAGENITIQQLFTLIAKKAGVPPPQKKIPDFVLHLLGGIGDLMDKMGMHGSLSRENAWTATLYHWFDSSKARKELNFSPLPAAAAIGNSVQWMHENHMLKK